MDWVKDVQKAIIYIEENLLNEIQIEDIADHVHASKDYFQKMFSMATGYTIREYVRNRRLSMAAYDVAYSKARIIDIALMYLYESPESFAKAFTRLYGFTPKYARSHSVKPALFHPFSIQTIINGGFSMGNQIKVGSFEIREGTQADISPAVEFLMRVHNPKFKKWFELMANGQHPVTNISNFIIAKDTTDGKIAALAIYQPWDYIYNGHKIKGTRLEEVFCASEYQGLGITKDILEKIKHLSLDYGCLFELVYGQDAIYGYYDEYGYTYGVPDEEDGYIYEIWDEKTENKYSIHEANDNDIPAIVTLYEKCYKRNLMTTAIGCKEIDYLKNTYGNAVSYESKFYVIKTSNDEICGFFNAQSIPSSSKRIYIMELDDNHSYHQIRPYLMAFYRQHNVDRIPLKLGKTHPVYEVFNDTLSKKEFSELGYVKIYDIPKFLMEISSVLNTRLAGSPYAYFTDTFTLATHSRNEAYQMEFLNGKLTNVSPIKRINGEVNIERNRLVRLMFGRVQLSEMEEEQYMYWFKNDDYRNVFSILFPQMQSHIFSIN